MLVSSATILRDLALVSLVLFFLWHNKEHVIDIGWTLKNGWKEVGLGIGLFIPLFFGATVLESALQAAGFSVPPTPLPALVGEKGLTEFLLAFILVIVVAVAEETIFRGYEEGGGRGNEPTHNFVRTYFRHPYWTGLFLVFDFCIAHLDDGRWLLPG